MEGEVFDQKGGMQIAPLIDVVFLLLIFFLDLSFYLQSAGN